MSKSQTYRREYKRLWTQRWRLIGSNREKELARQRAYRDRNPDKVRLMYTKSNAKRLDTVALRKLVKALEERLEIYTAELQNR